MLFRLIKYVRGYVEVILWGYAPERFLNLCNNHGILLWDLSSSEGVYQFKVSLRGFRALRPLLKKTRTKLKITKKCGLPFFLFRYRRRKVLILGVVLCCLLLFAMSRFLWKVTINGNSGVTDDSILQFLSEQDSSYGTMLSKIDCEHLEEELRGTFDQIVWASVKRQGTTLTIDVQENLVVTGDANASTKEFRKQQKYGFDLVALHDGTVDSIFVRQGTPMVQQGDSVSKGDVLVSGALPIYSDDGSIVSYQYCTADADIKLKTDYSYEESFPLLHEVLEYSGESRVRYGIQLLSQSYYLPAPDIAFKEYTVTENRHQLRLCGNFYLPVSLIQKNYEETKTSRKTYSKKEAIQQAEKDLSDFLEKLTQKGVFILKKNVMIDVDKKSCHAKGNISVWEQTFRYRKTTVNINNPDEGKSKDESE